MKCPNCGEDLEEDFKFCPYCEEDLASHKQYLQDLDPEKTKQFKYAQDVREAMLGREEGYIGTEGMVVEYRGKEVSVKERAGLFTLTLSNMQIEDIGEIKGLSKLSNLEVLLLDHNHITKINGLDSLTSLRILNLSSNHITKIEGLEHLTNLEELNLELNQIKVVESLDSLTKLREINLFGNNISRIESFKNKENLKRFLFGSSSPLYKEIKDVFGSVNTPYIKRFLAMSEEEKRLMRKKTLETIIRGETYSERKPRTAPKQTSSSGILALVICAIVGVIFLIVGGFALFNSFGGIFALFSGGSVPSSLPIAITLIIIGIILLAVGTKGGCCAFCGDAVCDC